MPLVIDGKTVKSITIDGKNVRSITIDGKTVSFIKYTGPVVLFDWSPGSGTFRGTYNNNNYFSGLKIEMTMGNYNDDDGSPDYNNPDVTKEITLHPGTNINYDWHGIASTDSSNNTTDMYGSIRVTWNANGTFNVILSDGAPGNGEYVGDAGGETEGRYPDTWGRVELTK